MPERTFLSQFQKARPKFEVPQDVLIDWMARAHLQARIYQENCDESVESQEVALAKMRKFVSRFACDSAKISSRGIQTDDAYEHEYGKMQIYKISPQLHSGVQMLTRTEFFSRVCNQVFKDFYLENAPLPEHLIHVTCTGYASPSGAQNLIAERNWNSQTEVTHAYHMGCYASLPAIRMAQALTNERHKKVDIIHTELCSLHLNPASHTPEQIVIQSLFADGFIKYVVSKDLPTEGLEVLKIKEFIVPDSSKMMTWLTADFGMQMTLSKDIAVTIAKFLPQFLEGFKVKMNETIFAIHPGGPKIIDSIEDNLKLEKNQVEHAKNILHKYGNMSSATLPHIWQDIVLDNKIKSGTEVMSLAFGPGLTIFGALLKKI